MPILHAIHGIVGSGKSTFAKKLESETKAIRFTHDEWMVDLFGTNPPVESFADNCDRVYKVIWKIAERALHGGADVIFDFGFWKRESRDRLRAFAEKVGADLRLYKLECPVELAKQRALKRTEEMPDGALEITENTFNILLERVEPLDPKTENYIVIDTSN